jgi:hypothetical protein
VAHVASTFTVEDYAKEETSMKQLATRALQGVIFQKREIFTTTAVKTSNPTNRGGEFFHYRHSKSNGRRAVFCC